MSEMNYEALRFWASVAFGGINLLGTIGVGVYAWIVSQGKDSARHIKALESVMLQKMAEHGSRLDLVETHMKYMPSPAQLLQMQGDLREIQATQRAQHDANTSKLSTLAVSVERIEDFLLGQKR